MAVLSAYGPGTKHWRAYVERLDQYFVANAIVDAGRKCAILLSMCGASTYQLIRDLVSLVKPADKTYVELVAIVTKHYNLTPSVTMSRYKFNSRKRGRDQSISSYEAALRQLSEFCQFGESLNDML